MRSLWTLFRTEPTLREAGIVGGLVFGSFSCFWTTLAFLAERALWLRARSGRDVWRDRRGGSDGGAVCGPHGGPAGRACGGDGGRRGADGLVPVAVAGGAGAVCMSLLHMAGLVIGVIVLDIGAQMMQVGNQTRIFGLDAGSAQPHQHGVYDDVLYRAERSGLRWPAGRGRAGSGTVFVRWRLRW